MKSFPGVYSIPQFLTAFTILIPAALSAVCYNPDSTSNDSGDNEFGKCPYLNDGTSMCCSLNRDNPSGGNFSAGNTADKCLQNGLCINIGTNDTGSSITTYFRDLCSESDWTKGCLNVCTDTKKNGTSDGTAQMTPCDGTKDSKYWCCGDSNSCCGTSDQVHINATFAPSKTTTTSTHHTATSTTTSTKAAATTDSSEPHDIPKGAKIGIAVGVGLGAIAVIIGFIRLCMRRRRFGEQVPTSDGFLMGPTQPYNQPRQQGYDTPVQYQGGYNGSQTAYPGQMSSYEPGMREKPDDFFSSRYEMAG